MNKIRDFISSHWKKIGFALLSLCLPMICVVAIYSLRGIVFRGDASLFTSMFYETTMTRIAQAKEFCQNLLSLGEFQWQGDIFVFLAALVSSSPMSGVLIAFMLCAGFTSLSFYLCSKGFGYKEIPSLGAALLYGLSGYAFVAFVAANTASLLFILPLLLLAQHRVIQKGKVYPFALALSAGFLLDVRSAWICLIAVIAWFFYDCYGFSKEEERYKAGKTLLRLSIGLAIALSIGISTFVFGFTHLEFSPTITIDANFDFISFFAKMLPSIYDGIRPDSLPYICFGILPILVLPLYFASQDIDKREKIASAILLCGLMLTMVARAIGCAIDLFGQDALPVYPQTAIFGFVALFLSARMLSLEKTKDHSPLFIAYGFLCFLLVIIQKLSLAYHTKDNIKTAEYVIDVENIWITLFLATILVFALHSFLKNNKKRVATVVAIGLLATVSLEAIFGQVKLLKYLQSEHPYYLRSELSLYYETYFESAQSLQEAMEIGYRSDKIHTLYAGENNFLGFNGIGNVGNAGSVASLLGGKKADGGVIYQSGIPALDALLSLKYLAEYHPAVEEETEKEDEEKKKPDKKLETLKKIKEALFPEDDFTRELNLSDSQISRLYRLLLEEENYSLWENPYALALLSSYSGDLKNLDFYFPSQEDVIKNEDGEFVFSEDISLDGVYYSPVDRLNAIWSELSGKDVALFKKLTDVQENAIFTTSHNCQEKTDLLGQVVYTANTGKTNPYIRFTMSIDTDAEVLMYLPAIFGREAEVTVNGQSVGFIHQSNQVQNGFVALGQVKEGSVMQVEIHFSTEKGYDDFYILKDAATENWLSSLFWVVDDNAFLDMMTTSSFGSFAIDKITDTALAGTFTPDAGETAVFTSLAYHPGTAVKVDGKKVDTYAVAGGLLGFDLPDDRAHQIQITLGGDGVSPLYFTLGIFGGVSILALALYECFGKDKMSGLFKKLHKTEVKESNE